MCVIVVCVIVVCVIVVCVIVVCVIVVCVMWQPPVVYSELNCLFNQEDKHTPL